ncbi:MAG: DNA mismatch repair endonuclease MutL [Lachnospiraceae bacterium]
MREIIVLDKQTIDQIAAGEVVERPVSVVKELVENAIDAGASSITVEIQDGGKTYIRISDNGMGFEKSQVPTAFLRHATSKMRKIEDLEEIHSLGFRGEALSSIGSVAQVELITKTREAQTGTRYVFEGGEEIALEEAGAADGTTFVIRNLFYNIPARSKFLKTDATEAGYISNLMEQLALSHPAIAFSYTVNDKEKLSTSGNGDVTDVIYQIYGKDVARNILPVQYQNTFLTITGFAGTPSISRGNRNFESYFINGRYVKNSTITKAIEDSYKTYMMQHKFPFVVLHIEMTGNDLDVNVHPTKMEVRFSKGQEVFRSIYAAIRSALAQNELIPEVTIDTPAEPKQPSVEISSSRNRWDLLPTPASSVPAPAAAVDRPMAADTIQIPEPPLDLPLPEVPWTQDTPPAKSSVSEEVPPPSFLKESPAAYAQEQEQMSLFSEPLLSEAARQRHVLIGQLFDTYWLVQYGSDFYIIDQHAAHEKVLYEKIVKQVREQQVISQYIEPPIIVSLTLAEEEMLNENLMVFEQFGFEIESFGKRQYSIRSVPSVLFGYEEEALFVEILDTLDSDSDKNLQLFAARLATVACKAAIKGNQQIDRREADVLIDELLQLENPYNCPHGRPTIIRMTKTEIEKKFKRIV